MQGNADYAFCPSHFAGHGNIIQYFDRKFGGITSIQPKKTCADTESTFLDSCSKNPNKPIDFDCNTYCETECNKVFQ